MGEVWEESGRLTSVIVPWIDKTEYEMVYMKLYSKDPVDRRWAVDRISAWSARNHIVVPSGVGATEALVRAQIQDYTVENNISLCNFSDVSLMYSMALIRFVNHITEEGQPYGVSCPLSQIAYKFGIPDWIVKLRHQATHSTTPPLEKLRLATETCLDWLDEHYWKSELANTRDFFPVDNYTEHEEICRETLSNFQKIQYQSLFVKEKPGKKREKGPTVKQIVAEIVLLIKTNKKVFISTLIKPEFLLSLTACSKLLVECSDSFIQQEAVTLPRNIEMFWHPVISAIHQKNLLGELVLTLLKSIKTLSDANQRMATAWIWKILDASAESWASPENKNSDVSKALRQHTPIFNWFELMDTCLYTSSKYIPALLPILIEHIFPPIPESKKNCLIGLVAISLGALADVHLNDDISTEGQRVYDVENIKTVLELQDVLDRGEKSLYYTESAWKVSTDDTDWEQYPLATVFNLENGILDPKCFEIYEVAKVKSEATNTPPEEPAVVTMVCDVNASLNESAEVTADSETVEEHMETEGDDSHVGADYCDPEDLLTF